ncbi:MAG: Gfo/Idh/MocA family oxidoreductase [Armatimonadetes bacterium]|nr:Gfo/Idh/MocA family oxidoreductase [Armatimonadota bacterium]
MADAIRWGILGAGGIARKMAEALNALPDADLAAVGSRDIEKARKFASECGIAKAYGSYAEMAADDNLDIIYVATAHPYHKDCTVLCLEHGKAVLCEKPFAVNFAEAEQMVETARKQKRFLMEAMWTRFLPVMERARQMVSEGAIGELRMLQADFGFRAGWDPSGRLLNPQLAGGGLLDVGVYTVSLASWFLGAPEHIASLAHLGQTGVDEQCAMLLGYGGGEVAILSSAVRTNTQHEAVLMGSEGMIRIPNFWRATRMTVTKGDETETIEMPLAINGFEYEAEECMRCIRQGKTESEVIGLNETLSIIRTMDEIRSQWGLKYPMEA